MKKGGKAVVICFHFSIFESLETTDERINAIVDLL